MARIAPFRGIRYDPSRFPGGDLSPALSPPYDVLSQADREAYVARHGRNIVVVDLPHMPPGYAGPPEAYEKAADALRLWREDGTLMRDDRAALYVYHQEFEHAGRAITRKMLFAKLRLEEFGRGSVYPHEQTFGGPKEDRLMLARATRCNLSPIFGLYPDSEKDVARILDVGGRAPTFRGSVDEVDNRVWVVDDEEVIGRAVEAMADRPVFIADGHHRYGTALMYRQELSGSISEDHPANFVLMVLCALEDDGLLILPTHRLLKGVEVDRVIAAVESSGAVALAPTACDATGDVAPGSLRIHDGAGNRAWDVTITDRKALEAAAPGHTRAWYGLDLAFLHGYLIERVIGPALGSAEAPEIRYIKDAGEGRRKARETGGLLIETAATSLDAMSEVCRAGELMPQKSTYFYPKLATGLVIHSLEA